METPLISFVSLTYKRPEHLNELLHCFLNQDYENKELIIINDDINVKYIYDDIRVKIYNLNNRFKTLGEKRNFSRNIVNGEFIFITDDDDIFYTNHVRLLINKFMIHSEFDLLYNSIAHYSVNNENIETYKVQNPFNGAIIRRKYFQSHYFPIEISNGEDQDFIKEARIYMIQDCEATFHYRWGGGIYHISGGGGDGNKSYEFIGKMEKLYDSKVIKLIPSLLPDTQKYYK